MLPSVLKATTYSHFCNDYFSTSLRVYKRGIAYYTIAGRPSAVADVFTKAVDKETFVLMRRHLLNLVEDEAYKATHTKAWRLASRLADMIGAM